MNVLWIVNVPIAQAGEPYFLKRMVGGGWMDSLAASLLKSDAEINLAVAMPVGQMDAPMTYENKGIRFYPLVGKHVVQKRPTQTLLERAQQIVADFKPDVIHIHGCEYAHGLAFVSRGVPVALSIQGLVHSYTQYYFGQMGTHRYKPTDWAILAPLSMQYFLFKKREKTELELLQKSKHIFGRTRYDEALSFAANDQRIYHHVGEMVRLPFYQANWQIEKAQRHRIFVGNASTPHKGFHMLLQAANLLKKQYPDLQIVVAGRSQLPESSTDWKRHCGYALYLRRLIKEFRLENHILFTGILTEQEMCDAFLKSHVFVLPSCIENSPATLSEAMLLGMPCVASDVGGVMDFAHDGYDALLYRYEEYTVLARHIAKIFDSDDLAISLSKQAKKTAQDRVSTERVLGELIGAYQSIVCEAESHI